eukprot:COSAG01_NODE_3926_length_5528_cov_26.315344_2_plen_246_part_00
MGTTKRRLRVVLDHFGTKSAPSASSIHSGGAGGGSSSSMSPHPGTPLLTKAFEWERDGAPPSCAAATLRVCTPAQAHQFSEQGYFLLEGAFGAAEIGAIRAHVDALEAELAHDGGISASGQISFCAHLVNRSATCRTFTAHHVLADLCSDLLGPDARLYWDQSVYKKPSSAGRIFPFHQVRTIATRFWSRIRISSVGWAGQWLHVYRAAALSHLLDRSQRRNTREWLPARRAWSASRWGAPPPHG